MYNVAVCNALARAIHLRPRKNNAENAEGEDGKQGFNVPRVKWLSP